MKRLSDFKLSENGIDVAAALLTPLSKLSANAEFKKLKDNGGFKLDDIVRVLAKEEPEALCQVFAILNETTVDEYKEKATMSTFIVDMYTMFSDEDIMTLFGFQLRKSDKTSSGAVTENTEAQEK